MCPVAPSTPKFQFQRRGGTAHPNTPVHPPPPPQQQFINLHSIISFPRLPFPSRPSSQPPSSRLASVVGVPCLIGKHTFVSSSVWTTPPLIYSGEEEKDSLLGKGKLPNTARREDDEGKKKKQEKPAHFSTQHFLAAFLHRPVGKLACHTGSIRKMGHTHTTHMLESRPLLLLLPERSRPPRCSRLTPACQACQHRPLVMPGRVQYTVSLPLFPPPPPPQCPPPNSPITAP